MTTSPYAINDASGIFSPALLFFKDLIRANLARMVELAGSGDKLRPHVKTHKTREIVRLAQAAGIHKAKCSTLAEAEMVASCGVADILLAYPLVGPNLGRLARLLRAYPAVTFSVLADHPQPVAALSGTLSREGLKVDVLLDVDVGQHRTGIAPGSEAIALYEEIARLPGLQPGGLHVYDGHNHQEDFVERRQTALSQLEPALNLRAALERKGLPVPRLVLGGTPTFPVYYRLDLSGAECSPGTCVLHDDGYGKRFADLTGFTPAALLLTRVISRPTSTRVTFDLGYKAVASDPPAGKRCVLLDVPDYEAVLQNEEHLVIETPHAARFQPGDEVLAIPTHVCPTVALHRFAYVIEGGSLAGTWDIVGRDRVLTI
jgi:D-serine deaminase-like pyridoxal phosphate-dependent protein